MHVSKKAQIFGRNSLFNLETTAALLFKNYRLQTLKWSARLSDDRAITGRSLNQFRVHVTYFVTKPISGTELTPYEFW